MITCRSTCPDFSFFRKTIVKRNRKVWDDGETECLLQVYKKARDEVRMNRRRRLLYDEIAFTMKADGFSRTGKEVKKKLKT